MKILYITGCLGFIGSAFTKRCLNLGWLVHGVDAETYAANIDLLDDFNAFENFKYHKSDIRNLDNIEDCDFIVNFAAESHVQTSIYSNQEFMDSNIGGVNNLISLVKSKPKNTIDRPLFLQISTDEVYGDIKEGSHFENDMLKPSNPYSASKAAADLLIQASCPTALSMHPHFMGRFVMLWILLRDLAIKKHIK